MSTEELAAKLEYVLYVKDTKLGVRTERNTACVAAEEVGHRAAPQGIMVTVSHVLAGDKPAGKKPAVNPDSLPDYTEFAVEMAA